MKTDIVQKAVIINKQGQLLALRRSNTDTRRPNQWDLPGGILDPNETLEEGIKREIQEETGLTINEVNAVYSRTDFQQWQDGQSNVVRIFYTASTTDNDITLSYEHCDFQWMYPKDALKKFEYEKQVKVISYLVEHGII